MELFTKIVKTIFAKNLRLRCFTGFWIRLPIVQSNQIFRVSLTLIAKSKHINYETDFWKTRFRMEYHPLLTIEPFQLWLPDILICFFNLFKNAWTLKQKNLLYITFCENSFLRTWSKQHLIQISRFTNFKFKRTKPFPHKMTIQTALQM